MKQTETQAPGDRSGAPQENGDGFLYQATLRAAFGALALLICLGGALSYYSIEESKYHFERRRLADEVLAAYLDFSATINRRLGPQALDALMLDEGTIHAGDNFEAHIRTDIDRIRELISNEVLLVGQKEDESEEIAALDHLEREIDQVLVDLAEIQALIDQDDRNTAGSRLAKRVERGDNERVLRLIDDAIFEERHDSANASIATRSQIRRLEIYLSITAALVLVLVTGIFFVLSRRLKFSSAALSKGADAIAGGEFDHRIPATGDQDLDLLGSRFNRMADDLKSDRKKLLDAQASLESAVAERTAQLEQANKRLEDINRTRQRFLADVGHELRTPLTVIRGEGEIALRGSDKEASVYKKSLRRMVEQVVHITNLLEDLLFIVRVGQGEARLSTRRVLLSEILEDVVRAFETVASERNISIRLQLDTREAWVRGDRVRLRQTFAALIDNALRLSESPGEVRVRLNEHGDQITVVVEDDGVGIPEEEMEFVFERFYRGDNAIRQAGSTGLGLPVAKAIVEAHGGQIAIAKKPAKGMIATITLPKAEALAGSN